MRNVLLIDLDGTLTDPAEGIIGCFRQALHAMGQTAPPAAALTWIIGPPLRRSFAEFLGASADAEEALSSYRRCYGTDGLFKATVYDGVPEALAELKAVGARLILSTAKPRVYAIPILHHFKVESFFEAAYGSELDGRFEDKGDLIAHILSDRKIDPGDCVMLGDRRHDVLAAVRHGIPAIGALWGYGGEQELREAGAAVLCARPVDVPAAFGRFRAAAARGKTPPHG